ncbi:hypothetical protein V7968_26170 [Nocardia vulneris]|uniref:hypothetical protein n=1 Tax=Nocardia vulneris TaxID=1141657 RepID=UPI0030CC3212
MLSLLSCADPLDPRRTDPHFAAETLAARTLGATVGLLDLDALLRGDSAAAVRKVRCATPHGDQRARAEPAPS